MSESVQSISAFWRDNIDSLAFQPDGYNGLCVIHRRAFRALLGFLPEPADCCAYFETQREIFQRAAAEKIAHAVALSNGKLDAHFHLNSRDIRKALAGHPE
jgi:hypothetical protein